MAYPSLANFINNQFSISTIGDYNTKVEKYNKEEIDKIMKDAYDYNNSLPGAFLADPFSGKNIYLENPSVILKISSWYKKGQSLDI